MSLKKNITANYASQIYLSVISIITLPELVKFLGPESYGLVAFFSLIQWWMILLDLGISPTLSREISRYRGGALNASSLVHLFRILKRIFWGIALACAMLVALFSGFIAERWLNAESLDAGTVAVSVMLMGFVVACRWVIGIYKSAVTGFEKLVWLSIYNGVFATLRFVVIFPAFILFGATPTVFFIYQLIVSATELLVIMIYTGRLMPVQSGPSTEEVRPIKELLGFSLTIAFTGAVWIFSTQTDKLLLSKMLSLSEFGYYTLAVQLAGGISMISGPISSAILPRLTKLEAEGRQDEMIGLYRFSTQAIMAAVSAVALVLIFFSEKVLFVWTGDAKMIETVSPYLVLYTIGNLILAAASFPYYLQYAKGNLKLHLYGNIGFVVLLLPVLILVVLKFGGIGAGYVWIGTNAAFLFAWIPYVHHYFVKGLNRKWYLNDILPAVGPPLILAALLSLIPMDSSSRFISLIQLAGIGCLLLLSAIAFLPKIRSLLLLRIAQQAGNTHQ